MQTIDFTILWPVVWVFAVLSLAIGVCIVLLILWALRRRRFRAVPEPEEMDWQELPEEMQACLRCGAQAPSAFRFCPACGKVLIK